MRAVLIVVIYCLGLALPKRGYDGIFSGYDKQLLTGLLTACRAMLVGLALTVDPSGALRTICSAFGAAAGKDTTGYAVLPVDSDRITRRFSDKLGDSVGTVPDVCRAVGSFPVRLQYRYRMTHDRQRRDHLSQT